jgi:hypothetical protein
MRLTFPRWLWLLAASGGYAALLVVVRGRPSLESDAGIFLSVAGRLLDGDRLYVDVLDNKDPLFYYSHAAALALGDWRVPFLLDVVWLAAAAAFTFLLLRAIGASRLTAAVGFVCLPLLLTGVWYLAGYSMLAALALVPLIGWLWIRGSFASAGALLCVGLLFKVNLALVLVSIPVAFLLLRLPAGAARSQLARAAAGFGAVAAAAVAIVVLRGELHGYLDTLIDNVAYSQDVLPVTGRPPGILGHIEAVAGAVGSPGHAAAVAVGFLVVGALAIRTLRERRAVDEGKRGPAAIRTVAVLFLVTTVATSVTLALTAAWNHHVQMLAYPGLLLIAFLVMLIRAPSADLRRAAAACVTAALAVVLMGGTGSYPDFRGSISTWLESERSETAELLERAEEERFPRLDEPTFAHLGRNDEEAVAAFLDGEHGLACPTIAQYFYSPDLAGVSRCIRERKPQLLLVTPSFKPTELAPSEWNRFVARGSSLLSRDYEPALARETGHGPVEVWTRRNPAATGPRS